MIAAPPVAFFSLLFLARPLTVLVGRWSALAGGLALVAIEAGAFGRHILIGRPGALFVASYVWSNAWVLVFALSAHASLNRARATEPRQK